MSEPRGRVCERCGKRATTQESGEWLCDGCAFTPPEDRKEADDE